MNHPSEPTDYVVEIVEFTAKRTAKIDAVHRTLTELEPDLHTVGGFISQEPYTHADHPDRWVVSYRWASIEDARQSTGRMSQTDSFARLMTLVDPTVPIRTTIGVTPGRAE